MRDERVAYDAWHARHAVDEDVATPWHRLLRERLDPERDLRGRRVLEIGCGRGGFACWLATQEARPADVVAQDFSWTAVRKGVEFANARGMDGVRWVVGDIQSIAHRDGTFDTVISSETIEHVPDPPAAVRELARVLRPGGRLFLTTPNYLGTMGLYRLYRRVVGRPYTEEGQPINNLVMLPRTRAWVAGAGLRVETVDAVGHYLPFPGRPPIELPWLDAPGTVMRWFGLHSLVVATRPGTARPVSVRASPAGGPAAVPGPAAWPQAATPGRTPHRPRCCLVVESGTDVRLVEGLAARCDLTLVARQVPGGAAISHPPGVDVPVVHGPPGRAAFATLVAAYLRGHRGTLDVVLVQGYGPAALAANVAGRLAGIPTLMLVCSPAEAYYRCRRGRTDGARSYRPWELAAVSALARLNAVVGQRYVVLSRHLAETVAAHGTRRPVSIIPVYGVDTTRFVPAVEPKRAIRERLGLPTTGMLLVFSSRVAPEKDAETLLAAVRQLRAVGRDLWVLHRSGGYRTFVERATALGVADRVIATDAVHPHGALPLDYQASDLCVQASREEGLGFSPLEALACQVPVVATAVGGLCETIVDGETGWTYPVGDADALARRIDDALRDGVEAGRRAANGRRLVVERFDSARVFDDLARLLTGVVEEWIARRVEPATVWKPRREEHV